VLSDAGIRITAVVSDPHGVAASAIIDCLLEGGTPAQALTLAGRLQAPREDLGHFRKRCYLLGRPNQDVPFG
jgi:hypothetical protein